MATIIKRGASYRAIIRRNGASRTVTKTFKTKSDALAWARKIESEIERCAWLDIQDAQKLTVLDASNRYENEILIKQKSYSVYQHHLKPIKSILGYVVLANLKPGDVNRYRESRLAVGLSPATVTKELSLLSRILDACVKDFGINLPFGNIVKNAVRYPKVSNERDRILTVNEEIRLMNALSESNEVKDIVRLSLETGMRRGETINMEWKHIDWKNRTLHIPVTKTDTARTIPLSSMAISILKLRRSNLEPLNVIPVHNKVFDITGHAVTVCFSRACKRAGIDGLHFHDLRRTCITRLFEKGLSIPEVSSISGHKTWSMLRRYTTLNPALLARKLADKDKGD